MMSQHHAAGAEKVTTDRYPLSGVVVIDLSHIYNGPYATYLMALAGAQVIKIEPHGGAWPQDGCRGSREIPSPDRMRLS